MPNAPDPFALLRSINSPADLRAQPESELGEVCAQLRDYLIKTVATRGGHFAAGLGTVELTVALHYVFETPSDRLVWDVGHQAYPHKVLTGRRDRLDTIKQGGGLAPFPTRAESEYDTFGVGHSSTSISAALGMAVAAELEKADRKVVAIIGDGAMTAGMAWEALFNAGSAQEPTCWWCSTTTTCRSPRTSARCPTISPRCCRAACIRRCARAARRSSSRCPRCGSWRAAPKK